jgi:hypothetical protein
MIETISLGTVLIPFVILVFAGVFYQIQKQNRREGPLRRDVLAQPIVFRSSMPMKINGPLGWSMKTLAGMEIVVTSFGVGARIRFLGLSDVIGAQYWAKSSELRAHIEKIVVSPWSSSGDWIVLSCQNPNRRFDVAVLAGAQQSALIRALCDTGVAFSLGGTTSP